MLDPSHGRALVLYLIDASIYVFRAYFSVRDALTDRDGQPCHAVFGFARFLGELIGEIRPQHIAVCFDESLTSSWRNQIYPPYKANRELPPEDLKLQFIGCRALCEALGLRTFADHDLEADDLIGAFVALGRRHGLPSTLVSADKDLTQLIGEHDRWWDYARRETLDVAGIANRFGVPPNQIAEFLALTGDSVDNIPGVPGVGPKTAAQLLNHFGSLGAVLDRASEVEFLRVRNGKAIAQHLINARPMIELALELTRIPTDRCPVDSIDALKRMPTRSDDLQKLFEHYRLGPLTRSRLLAI
jgi:DNA polymerase I